MNENKSDLDIDSSDIKLENLTTAMFEFNNLDQLYLATKSNSRKQRKNRQAYE